jgi:hypothetical protein
MSKEIRKAVAYLRTSTKANVGANKDSNKRQRAARCGFGERGARASSRCRASPKQWAKTVIVESPNRFALQAQ